MALDPVPQFASPLFGSEAQALLSIDGVYEQEPMLKGAAVSYSADPTKPLDIFNTGNPAAVPQLLGVMNSTPRAPGLQSMGPGFEETLQIVTAGRCAVLLAPGQAVLKGQFMEPIGAAAPGLWRATPASGRGSFQALESINNTGGTQPVFVSGNLFPSSVGAGLLGMITVPSLAITGATELAFNTIVKIPKNVLTAGQKVRISALVDFVSGNPGDKVTLAVYLGGLAGLSVAQSNPAGTAFVTGDQGILRLELDIQSAGLAGKLLASGEIAIGTLGTATMVAVGKAGSQTVNTTVDQQVTVSGVFSSASPNNQAVLRALAVELIN